MNSLEFSPIIHIHYKQSAENPSVSDLGSLHFLELIDYDFDGIDELLFIETGYEKRDVILYRLTGNELVEIYRIDTSMS